jgi:hypothetical protein
MASKQKAARAGYIGAGYFMVEAIVSFLMYAAKS